MSEEINPGKKAYELFIEICNDPETKNNPAMVAAAAELLKGIYQFYK